MGADEVDEQYALQAMGLCVAGFPWDPDGSGGYVCQGGSHFVDAAALAVQMGKMKKGTPKDKKIWKQR